VYAEKLKSFKPTSPGIRFRRIIDRSPLWKGKPVRELTKALRKTGGRNNHGHITVRHSRRYIYMEEHLQEKAEELLWTLTEERFLVDTD